MGFTQVRRRFARQMLALGAVVVAAGTAACGGGPDSGPTPLPAAPAITCPSDISTKGVTGGGQAVSYPAPVTTGGSAPVTTSCSPVSGSTFPIGTTAVSCTARDSAARQATCSFAVTLSATTLTATKFLAFGDSVTEGQNGRTIGGFRVVDVPNSYPTKLQGLFDFEFPGQGIVVTNHGQGGVTLEEAVKTLGPMLDAEHPDGLLILHGYNDLGVCPPGSGNSPTCKTAIQSVVNKLRECVQIAREPKHAVRYIFVSTLTPPGPAPATPDRRRDAGAITQTNTGIRQMVSSEGVVLVDPHPAFLGHEAEYVDIDGLHLRPAGNDVLANNFFVAIKRVVPANLLFRF
jgi:lysophospholipase L1-like esterase